MFCVCSVLCCLLRGILCFALWVLYYVACSEGILFCASCVVYNVVCSGMFCDVPGVYYIMLHVQRGFVMCRVCTLLYCLFIRGFVMCYLCTVLCCFFREGFFICLCILYYVACSEGVL